MIEAAPFTKCHLMLTEDCNLKCRYCYENVSRCDSSYMSFDTAKKTADFLIDNALKHGENDLQITFFGGEPLLNIEVMKKFFHYAVEKASQYDINLFFSIITNGTIYNKEFEEFVLEWYRITKKVLIQISVDGIPEVQNKNRITKNGKPTSGLVLENIIKLKTLFEQNQIKPDSFHTHSVITKDNISKFFLSYKYLRQLGIKKLEFMLSDEEDWNGNDISIYIEQMSLISDYVYQECITSYSLKPYEDAKGIIFSQSGNLSKATCEAGKSFCAITPNGDIYPCSRTYFYNRSFKLGNVFNGIIDNEIRKTFFDAHRSDMYSDDFCCGECKNKSCKICMAYNYQKNGDVLKCNTLLCSMYKAKWDFLIKTKEKFDKLSKKLYYNKCNEMSFLEATNQ